MPEIGMTLGSGIVTARILKHMTWLSSLPFMLFLCLRVGNQPISLRASAKRRWQLWSQM
jgi:hypothetical protein